MIKRKPVNHKTRLYLGYDIRFQLDVVLTDYLWQRISALTYFQLRIQLAQRIGEICD